MCAVLEHTGLTTGCDVNGWHRTIDVRIDTTGSEGRKICAGMAKMTAQQTGVFQIGQWKLRILSPFSGDQPIAVCALY